MDTVLLISLVAGVPLVLLGLVAAFRGLGPQSPHSTGVGRVAFQHPGPGLSILGAGLLVLVVPQLVLAGSGPRPDDSAIPQDPRPGTPTGALSAPSDEPSVVPEPGAAGPATRPPDTVRSDGPGTQHEVTVTAVYGESVDLDAGTTSTEIYGPGDLAVIPPGYMVGLGSRIALGAADDLTGCESLLASRNDPEVPGDVLAQGASFCVRTPEGAVAQVVTAPWQQGSDVVPPPLRVSWTLWE